MGPIRKSWLILASEIVWRFPQRSARLLAKFSQAERGSSYDMLAAAELTEQRSIRRKYLEHALDEATHARIFRSRALALGVSREEAAMMDIGYLSDHGIVQGDTLFEQMGELKFLAFIHIAEQRGLEQFTLYRERNLPDPETFEALGEIAKDENFHMTYSLAELKKYRAQGKGEEVDKALRSVHIQRWKEAWLRFGRGIGHFMSQFWLLLIYFLAVSPFSILAKEEPTGWSSLGKMRTAKARSKNMLSRAKSQF